jgi:hypothetical protein
VSHSLVRRVALAFGAAALVAPAAQAGISKYDGYKSSYPQLHQLRAATIPDPDYKSSYPQLHEVLSGAAGVPDPDLKSSYPQLHQVLSGAVRTPAVVATGHSGVDWRDAGLGALVGAFAAGLLGSVALRLRRSRLPALR